MIATLVTLSGVVVILNETAFAFAGTMTTGGTPTNREELVMLIASPVAGAALLRTTVPVSVSPPKTCPTLKTKLLTPGNTHGCSTITGTEEVALNPLLSVAIAMRTFEEAVDGVQVR